MADRAREVEPKLLMKSSSSGSRGGEAYFKFLLSNDGAIAHKVSIQANCQFKSLSPKYVSEIRPNNSVEVTLEFQKSKPTEGFLFEVAADDREGARHSWEYRVQVLPTGLSVENMFGTKAPPLDPRPNPR